MNKYDAILESLMQEAVSKMPDSMQSEIRNKDWRKKQMRKHGTSVFLDPANMKFPIKYNGKYDCRMIHAATIHAAMYSKEGSSVNKPKYYRDILDKAKEIYAKNKCENEIKVKLQQEDTVELSLIDIFEIYNFTD